jgi:hypothetical protein
MGTSEVIQSTIVPDAVPSSSRCNSKVQKVPTERHHAAPNTGAATIGLFAVGRSNACVRLVIVTILGAVMVAPSRRSVSTEDAGGSVVVCLLGRFGVATT